MQFFIMKMNEDNPGGLLEISLALLPKGERKRYVDGVNDFIENFSGFKQRRKEIISQIRSINLEFLEGNLSERYAFQEGEVLARDMDRTFYGEIKCSFDFLQKIFGFERTEEILRDLYDRAQIDLSPTFEKSGLNEQEINAHYDKMLQYLDLVFSGESFPGSC